MMKLFGSGKPEHAMAERKEARRILDHLPAQDMKAVEELAHWHESASQVAGFKPEERAERLAMIDEAAQPRLRRLVAEYLAAARSARGSRAQQNLLWTRVHEYWMQAALAYARCIEARPTPEVFSGAIRAAAQQLKWQQLRYGPIDPAAWGLLNRVFAAAEARAIPGAQTEFLKAAMFGASSPDSLPPVELELAERMIAELAPGFVLAKTPAPELPYWIDLGRASAPARVAKAPQPSVGLRCFGPGRSAATLRGWIERAAKRQLPAELNLAPGTDPELVAGVMQHLALYWASEPPARQHRRVAMQSSLKVLHGFDGVLEALGGGNSLDFGGGAAGESWSVENVSAGGFGARASQAKSEWLKVGALIAAKPDNTGSWMVGTVRRVSKISSQEVRVGVETLSRAPALSQFALRNTAQADGVLLPAPGPGAEAAIALRAGVYLPGENLEARVGERQHVYMPQRVAARGEDYEIVKFREMIRES